MGKEKKRPNYQFTPLSGTFMITSILGFLIVTVYTAYDRIALPWGFSFALIFVIMFIASVISITPRFDD